MAVRKYSFLSLLFISSCAIASSTESVILDNQLSACITINEMKISEEGKVPVISFDLHINKLIAECGCKSALGSYAVFSKMEEYNSYVIGGKVAMTKSERKYLPLSAERSLIAKKKLIINFSCAQPD